MKKQTLKELNRTLMPNEQANLIRFFTDQLFVMPSTAFCYIQGYRAVPILKRQKLAAYIAKTYSIDLQF